MHPPLPSKHQGWNAGKGDCRHCRTQLGFCILMGTGFIQDSAEVLGRPLEHIGPISWWYITTTSSPHTSSMTDLAIYTVGL